MRELISYKLFLSFTVFQKECNKLKKKTMFVLLKQKRTKSDSFKKYMHAYNSTVKNKHYKPKSFTQFFFKLKYILQ